MRNRFVQPIAVILIAIASVAQAAAQQTVSGRVTAAQTGAALVGALVSVEGSTTATLTGQDGRYSIQAPATGTLIFAMLGYDRHRVSVQGRATIDAALRTASIQLDEVVAVGYGQQQGAVSGSPIRIVGGTRRVEAPSGSSVTLRFQLIEADGFSERDPAIADVEAALRSLFRFSGYRLLGQSAMTNLIPMPMLRTERRSWADYQVTQKVTAGGAEYGILTDVGPVSRSQGGSVVVDLEVLLYRNRPDGVSETLLRTSVRVPDGQTIVLGSASGAAGENTIILAVRPEIND